jgi:hypothetical protein
MAEHLLAKIWTGVYQDPEKTFPARNDPWTFLYPKK